MIDWRGIVNNAVSVLVAAVFVGAAAIVWTKVTTIDDTVDNHTAKLRANQDSLIGTQSELKASQTALTDNILELHAKIEQLNNQIISLQDVLREIQQTKTTKVRIPANKPLILPQYKLDDARIRQQKEAEEERIRMRIQSLKPDYKPQYQEQFQRQIQLEKR